MRRLTAAAIATITLGLLAAPLAAGAQQPKNVPRIGVLWPYSPYIASSLAEAFRQGLRGMGYVEGQNIAIEERWAEGRYDRLPSLAAELVQLNVDIIVAVATSAVQAAKQATTTIPIIMAFSNNPVESGLVARLARPGGNITRVESPVTGTQRETPAAPQGGHPQGLPGGRPLEFLQSI